MRELLIEMAISYLRAYGRSLPPSVEALHLARLNRESVSVINADMKQEMFIVTFATDFNKKLYKVYITDSQINIFIDYSVVFVRNI